MMIARFEIDRLTAELASIDAMLERRPAGDVLGRMSLESRKERLAEQLGELAIPSEPKDASVALLFGGSPVFGSKSIDAGFASEALKNYEALVDDLWVPPRTDVKSSKAASSSKTIPPSNAPSPKLHLSNILHGSFGFELVEVDAHDSQSLKPAIELANQAIIAASTSDEALADAIEAR
jgi:hypothetical protein